MQNKHERYSLPLAEMTVEERKEEGWCVWAQGNTNAVKAHKLLGRAQQDRGQGGSDSIYES